MKFRQRISKNLDLSLALSVFAGFMAGIFAPLELYLSNKDSFFFSGEDILVFAMPIFVAGVVLGVVVLQIFSIINISVYKYLTSAVFAVLLFVYLQGNFDRADYGVWDGTDILWENYAVQKVIWWIILLICIIAVLLIAYRVEYSKYKRIIKSISICIVLLQLLTLGMLLSTNGGLKKEPEYLAIEDGENEFSKEENVILLILDSYDGTMLPQILSEDNEGYYWEILRDFTFYPDTAGVYSYTNLAIPHIITGEKYYNDMTYGEYLEEAYSQSKLLNKLDEAGWQIGIYSEALFPQDEELTKKIYNSRKIKRTVSSHVRLAKYLYEFIGFRYLPQPFKKAFVFYPEDMEAQIGDNEGGYTLFDQTNEHFERLMSDSTADSDCKCFKVLHLFGAHPPYHLNANNEYSETETTEEEVCKANLELVNAFLNKLREIEAYENSTIIICADHGVMQSRQNPLFMIKYKADDHDLGIDDTAFSYDSLQDILCSIAEGKNKTYIEAQINSYSDNERIYLNYSHDTLNMHSYCQDIEEFRVDGVAYYDESLKATGKVYGRAK